MWASNEIDWIEIGAVNNGGGVITMWKKDCFEMKRYRTGATSQSLKEYGR